MHHVLITGSSGMIGTSLAISLLSEGYSVTGADIRHNRWSDEINDRTVVFDLIKDEFSDLLTRDFDMIIHLAANARVHKLVQDPSKAKDNFEMTFNVLEYARETGVSNLVFGSSREIYGNKSKVVYSEKDTLVDECESPYTASKVGGEAMVKAYEQCYDIDACILRFSNVYGRYDVSDRVIPLFISRASRGNDLTVYGGDKVLDFTYLDDCVDGITRAIRQFNKAKGTTFNIASGQGYSLVELAKIIANRFDDNIDIHVKSNRTGEISRYVADITKAQKILGYNPECTFEEGIEATIDWYSQHDLVEEIIE